MPLRTLKVILRSNYTRLLVLPDTKLEHINWIAAADNDADVVGLVLVHPAIADLFELEPLVGEEIDVPVYFSLYMILES